VKTRGEEYKEVEGVSSVGFNFMDGLAGRKRYMVASMSMSMSYVCMLLENNAINKGD
jgi:hypothetical protein